MFSLLVRISVIVNLYLLFFPQTDLFCSLDVNPSLIVIAKSNTLLYLHQGIYKVYKLILNSLQKKESRLSMLLDQAMLHTRNKMASFCKSGFVRSRGEAIRREALEIMRIVGSLANKLESRCFIRKRITMQNLFAATQIYYLSLHTQTSLLISLKSALQQSLILFEKTLLQESYYNQTLQQRQSTPECHLQLQFSQKDKIQSQGFQRALNITCKNHSPKQIKQDDQQSELKNSQSIQITHLQNNPTEKKNNKFSKYNKKKKNEKDQYKHPRYRKEQGYRQKTIATRHCLEENCPQEQHEISWKITEREMLKLRESLNIRKVQALKKEAQKSKRPRELAYLFSGY